MDIMVFGVLQLEDLCGRSPLQLGPQKFDKTNRAQMSVVLPDDRSASCSARIGRVF